MSKKETKQAITYTGIAMNPPETESVILDKLMRKFQSAKRFLCERIFDGLDRNRQLRKQNHYF